MNFSEKNISIFLRLHTEQNIICIRTVFTLLAKLSQIPSNFIKSGQRSDNASFPTILKTFFRRRILSTFTKAYGRKHFMVLIGDYGIKCSILFGIQRPHDATGVIFTFAMERHVTGSILVGHCRIENIGRKAAPSTDDHKIFRYHNR